MGRTRHEDKQCRIWLDVKCDISRIWRLNYIDWLLWIEGPLDIRIHYVMCGNVLSANIYVGSSLGAKCWHLNSLVTWGHVWPRGDEVVCVQNELGTWYAGHDTMLSVSKKWASYWGGGAQHDVECDAKYEYFLTIWMYLIIVTRAKYVNLCVLAGIQSLHHTTSSEVC